MAKKKKEQVSPPSWLKYMWWCIPLVAILVYLPSFQAGFTLDDVLIVEENTFIKSLTRLPDIWSTHYWAGKPDASDTGLYRPLTLSTYAIQYAIHDESAAGYHIFNVLLHALVTLALMKCCQLLCKEPHLPWLAGLLFAVHPLHTEAVAGIVGRAELMAALFILTAMMSYHQYRKNKKRLPFLLLIISAVAAMTSKEHGFMLPAILLLQEFYYHYSWKNHSWSGTGKWIAMGSVLVISILLWMIRASVTGPTIGHELWADVSAGSRMATSIRIMGEYVWMHLLPVHLTADYWVSNAPITGWSSYTVWVSMLGLAGLIFLVMYGRKKWPVLSWGLAFFLMTLLPVSNFLFAAGFVKAERILYIPSLGLIVGLAYIFIKLMALSGKTVWLYAGAGMIAVIFSVLTWIRTGDWKDNYTLAVATLKTTPDSPRFNNMMGLELRAQKRNAEALVYFEKSIASNPFHVPALVNLGTEYRNQGRLPEAAATLEKALETDPNTLATYVNLMSVYRNMEDYDKNLTIAKKALNRYPASAPIMWNAANAYHLKGDIPKAEELRAAARKIDPNIGGGK